MIWVWLQAKRTPCSLTVFVTVAVGIDYKLIRIGDSGGVLHCGLVLVIGFRANGNVVSHPVIGK